MPTIRCIYATRENTAASALDLSPTAPNPSNLAATYRNDPGSVPTPTLIPYETPCIARGRSHSSAALGALRSQAEDAAESAVDIVHKGCRQVASGCLEVSLVEGDQGGDIDD